MHAISDAVNRLNFEKNPIISTRMLAQLTGDSTSPLVPRLKIFDLHICGTLDAMIAVVRLVEARSSPRGNLEEIVVRIPEGQELPDFVIQKELEVRLESFPGTRHTIMSSPDFSEVSVLITCCQAFHSAFVALRNMFEIILSHLLSTAIRALKLAVSALRASLGAESTMRAPNTYPRKIILGLVAELVPDLVDHHLGPLFNGLLWVKGKNVSGG
ncbi:hypothetical protein C8J56DRAFT_92723 [Mycena floridula]|nr:hypothetical protein C8J56DRAFT_92723 [Mycena floridula]